jgi:hypothetical protein
LAAVIRILQNLKTAPGVFSLFTCLFYCSTEEYYSTYLFYCSTEYKDEKVIDRVTEMPIEALRKSQRAKRVAKRRESGASEALTSFFEKPHAAANHEYDERQ